MVNYNYFYNHHGVTMTILCYYDFYLCIVNTVADVTTDGSSSTPRTTTETVATNNTKPTDSSHTQPNLGSLGKQWPYI